MKLRSLLLLCVIALVLMSCQADFSGQPIAFTSERVRVPSLFLINLDGTDQLRLTDGGRGAWDPAWSPDGTRIAFIALTRTGKNEIHVMSADGSNERLLCDEPTCSPVRDGGLSWSSDGSQIAYTSLRDGNFDISVVSADGSRVTRLTRGPHADWGPTWAPDGSAIAFTSSRDSDIDGPAELYTMHPDGSEPTRLTKDAAHYTDPVFSPDGTSIAFTSGDLFLIKPDGSEQTRLTDTGVGSSAFEPAWSPDGTRLIFESLSAEGTSELAILNVDTAEQTTLETEGDHPVAHPDWASDSGD